MFLNAIKSRLARLERLLRQNTDKYITVRFADGSSRRMAAADAIPLLQSPDSIVDVCGESGGSNGLLLELIKGLLDQ